MYKVHESVPFLQRLVKREENLVDCALFVNLVQNSVNLTLLSDE